MRGIQPTVAIVHYSAPPIVGGVEAVMAEHAHLLVEAGHPTMMVVGRGGGGGLPDEVLINVIPELDTEYPENVAIASAFDRGQLPPRFSAVSERIERGLGTALGPAGVVITHNVMTTHFNLPLTAALHRLIDQKRLPPTIVWCHDISRYVNPTSGFPQRAGSPWDLLRTYKPAATYVAVSHQRQRSLAQVLGCPEESIQVIPNGVNPAALLGLSDFGQSLMEECGLLGSDLILLMPVRITRAKNIEFGLHVAAILRDAGLRIRLIVTGPPDPHAPDRQAYFGQLRALRQALQLDQQAIFLYEGTSQRPGPLIIDDNMVGELYRVCDLILMPSHHEGFGMPVLEAGLVDKPVFATDMPVVEDFGEALINRIERDESPAQVAQRIMAWADRDKAYGLRRRVRQAYTWPTIFATMIEPLIATLAARTGERVS